jgi:hypothetical protein
MRSSPAPLPRPPRGRGLDVETVEADDLGFEHARLVSVANLQRRKTLSVRALAHPTRFEEV